MQINFRNIILRDMKKSDIEDNVRWWTVQTEWSDWDTPWENIEGSEQASPEYWQKRYEVEKNRSESTLRSKFEIEYEGMHIGWVSSYVIDENYECIDKIKEGKPYYLAVGIDICVPEIRSKGIGTNALKAFVNYYFDNGINEIYTQTWSGNLRMIRCAEKIGFTEFRRDKGIRQVRGGIYDKVTFRLEKGQML